MLKMAAIQMCSGENLDLNLKTAACLIQKAAQQGAKLCVLPENFALMTQSDKAISAIIEPAKTTKLQTTIKTPLQDFLSQQAQQHHIWVVGGTIPLTASVSGKYRSACLVFDAQGRQVVRYDKLHLFDVQLPTDTDYQMQPASQNAYQESRSIEAGQQLCVFDSPFGKIGLAICYDLRFPELFRCLMQRGAKYFIVPAAFTLTTGEAHWETLLKARALENLAYVIAANQGGHHPQGQETYGHSMIIDPWGQVLARLTHDDMRQKTEMIITAEIDSEKQRQLRHQFPCLSHQRFPCVCHE